MQKRYRVKTIEGPSGLQSLLRKSLNWISLEEEPLKQRKIESIDK